MTWKAVGEFFKKVWQFVSSAAKPTAKSMAIAIIQAEGDALQSKLETEFAVYGPAGVDKAMDAVQTKLIGALNAKWIPGWLRDSLAHIIKDEGDIAQEKMREAARIGGAAALRIAFDNFQSALICRIQSL